MEIEKYSLSEIEVAAWDELAERSGSATPYCRHAWLKLLEAAGPAGRAGLWLAREGGKTVAGLPFVERRGRLRAQSHSLPGGCPAGALEAPGAPEGAAETLLESWAASLEATRLPGRLAVTFPDDKPRGLGILRQKGFRVVTQTAYRVNLAGRSFEDWEAALRQEVRNKNRQALKRGGAVEQVTDPRAAGEIMRLAALTARFHKNPGPPYGEKFYRLLLDPGGPLSGSPGLARVYLVRAGGRPAAFDLCLVQGRKMWLADHGADETAFEYRPNNLLYRHLIGLAFREGLEALDLGAAPAGAASLEQFKAGLGGEPYQRVSAVKATPLFRLGAALRAAYHRLR